MTDRRRLIAEIRNDECEACKMHRNAGYVCLSGKGNPDAAYMVVGRMPNSKDYQVEMEEYLLEVGLDPTQAWFTSAIRCAKNFEDDPSNLDVKACRQYLNAEVGVVKPRWILALGNEALFSTTGRSGITKYRGRAQDGAGELAGIRVFPTISPASVRRNPGQRPGFLADLRLFAAEIKGTKGTLPKPKLWRVDTKEKVHQLGGLMAVSDLVSYDVETTRSHQWQGQIICLCGTVPSAILGRDNSPKDITWMLPLYHPESPFQSSWRSVLRWLNERWVTRKQVAHNGKFDARWLRYHGLTEAKVTFDTMLAAHLLDENRQKGLKPQAASRLGVKPWAMDTHDLLSEPLGDVLKYCALDTYYTYHIYLQIKEELKANPRLARIFQILMMPASEELLRAELRGVWVDRERVATGLNVSHEMVREIGQRITEFIPDQEHWPKDRRGKPRDVNLNPSIFARWFLFDHLELPILARGKKKPDGSPGDPSMAEAVMLALKPFHPAVELMLERANWVKMTQFFSAYDTQLDPHNRLHSVFKLYGTVTGRLSSGREDPEKLTGIRGDRGINLQQVPRKVEVRGCFGAAPGYAFVEVDFSQVELRVIAHIAPEPTMIHLYNTGQDIHRATASWVLGIPPDKISKEDRKKAKAVNFGFAYGMGAKKFVATAFANYEAVFTLDEAVAVRKEFFRQFAGLLSWHVRMRRLVHENARVHSPIGRVRHLPDIRSGDDAVVGEAERQAINSPVQSFASDMNLLGMIEAMKAIREKGLDVHVLGTVHDATLFEVKLEHLHPAMAQIKRSYETLPLKRKFGVELSVPIVADLKVGTHWGDATEVPQQVWAERSLADFLTTIPGLDGRNRV